VHIVAGFVMVPPVNLELTSLEHVAPF